MNDLSLFTAVALAHLLAVMSPGPDFAMVVRQTLSQGRSAGIWTALGIGSGIMFHVSWGLFGLGWIIQQLPSLLDVLRYAGALFLLYMGWQAIRAQPATENTAVGTATQGSGLKNFGIGLATNLLNPKCMMFFIALCSAVITTQTPLGLRIALGLWITLSTALWFCLVSYTLGLPVIRQRLQAYAHWIDRAMGAVLLLLGTGMLLTHF